MNNMLAETRIENHRKISSLLSGDEKTYLEEDAKDKLTFGMKNSYH